MKKEKHNKLNDTINLEEFLLENNFELDYIDINKQQTNVQPNKK